MQTVFIYIWIRQYLIISELYVYFALIISLYDFLNSFSLNKFIYMGQCSPESPTYQVCHTVQITAHGQEDDGPLRVGETLWIQQKGQDRQSGWQEAQHGPHCHPCVCEDFGSSAVEPAVVATLESTAFSLFEPSVLVGCRSQGLTLLLVGRMADGLVGRGLIARTLHTHVVVVILRWEEAAVEHLEINMTRSGIFIKAVIHTINILK